MPLLLGLLLASAGILAYQSYTKNRLQELSNLGPGRKVILNDGTPMSIVSHDPMTPAKYIAISDSGVTTDISVDDIKRVI